MEIEKEPINVVCDICKDVFADYKLFAIHLRFKHKISAEKYYTTYINPDKTAGTCRNCGKPTAFLGIGNGFQEYCSRKCANSSSVTLETRKKNCLKKYGVENYAQTKECRDKTKATCLERYGVEHAWQSEQSKQKSKETCIKKYGVENYAQTQECRVKIGQTCLEKYGDSVYQRTDEYRNKSKTTCLERYGVEHIGQAISVKEKIKSTSQEHYGLDCPFQSDKVKEKIRNTSIERYGTERPSQSEVVKEKIKQTNREKYGVENYAQTKECRDKTKATCLERYGVEHAPQDEHVKSKMRASLLDRYGQLGISYSYRFDNRTFDSSWELAYYIWLKDNVADFEYHPKHIITFEYDGQTRRYCPDFRVDQKFYEIKGPQFFEDHDPTKRMINPYDRSLDGLFEAKRMCMIENGVEIITDCTRYLDYVEQRYGKDYIYNFSKLNIDKIYDELDKDFPYRVHDIQDMRASYEKLKSTDNHYSGMDIVNHYFKNIFSCNIDGHMSPVDAWHDEKTMKRVIANRLQYVGHCRPCDILRGLSVTKIAPKVSVFRPQLAKQLIKRYLDRYDAVFDPFSGFGGRMLGAAAAGKRYIGQDINRESVAYAAALRDDFALDADISERDVLSSTGEYGCLFACPPYGSKEHWNAVETVKTCDEWIDVCMERFRCERYLFVVDKTEKYQSNIVETVTNRSHFGLNRELVLLIEGQHEE